MPIGLDRHCPRKLNFTAPLTVRPQVRSAPIPGVMVHRRPIEGTLIVIGGILWTLHPLHWEIVRSESHNWWATAGNGPPRSLRLFPVFAPMRAIRDTQRHSSTPITMY